MPPARENPDLQISNAITKAHIGICVCHSSIQRNPRVNVIPSSTAYHHSGTIGNTCGDEHEVSCKMRYNNSITLWVYTHETSMDIRFFSQGSSTLLNNLLPEV